jgi:hypothetical protein
MKIPGPAVSAAVMIDVPAHVVGIYHLMLGNRVRYIGQTVNIFSRICSWRTNPRIKPGEFDRVAFYPCTFGELDALELEHIKCYQPEMNSEGVRKPYRSRPWIRASAEWVAKSVGGKTGWRPETLAKTEIATARQP